MQCEDMQELIKTNYIDGELGETSSKRVKAHIGECKACAQLEASLLNIQHSFEGSKLAEPPSDTWNNIVESIDANRSVSVLSQLKSACDRMVTGLVNVIRLPRPVMGVSFGVILLLVVAISGQSLLLNQNNSQVGTQLIELAQLDSGWTEDSSIGSVLEIFLS